MVTGERIWHSMKETASPVSSLSINLIELLLSLYIFFFGGGVSQILKESGPRLLRRHFLVPTVHEFLLHLSLMLPHGLAVPEFIPDQSCLVGFQSHHFYP